MTTSLFSNEDNTQNDAQRFLLATTNSLMIFTSQDLMSSGRYSFDDGANTRVKITSIPFTYHFEPSFTKWFNFFAYGSVGKSQTYTEVFWNIFDELDTTTFDTYAIKAGGGMRVKSSYDLEFLMGVSFIYSYIQNSYQFNSQFSQDNREVLEELFANKNLINYSYEFFSTLAYRPNFGGYKPYILLNFHLYDTKANLEAENLTNLTTKSSLSQLKLGIETKELIFPYKDIGVSFEVYTIGNGLDGDVAETFIDTYGESGILTHLYTKSHIYGISRFSLGYSQVLGENFSGYNLGFGLSLGF